MPRVFFVINQDILDGSAHALYCFRHCWWLAKTKADAEVNLIYPGRSQAEQVHRHFGFETLPNLRLTHLPALRKTKGQPGLTVDLFYCWVLYFHLKRTTRKGDYLVSASFPKLASFLLRRRHLLDRLRRIYEVHQLALLDEGAASAKTKLESKLLAQVDSLIATTETIREVLQAHFPHKPIYNLGLACGFSPADFPPARRWEESGAQRNGAFVLAYIGSVYREQGVEWLISQWPMIRSIQGVPIKLEIVGGNRSETARLQQLISQAAAEGISAHGSLPPARLAPFLEQVDALIMPALREGRMQYVALTKAYDYLGLNRPVIAGNLKSIAEVMRPGREALLFEAGDAASLKEALKQLIAAPDLRKSLTAQAARRSADFSWQSRAESWWEKAGLL